MYKDVIIEPLPCVVPNIKVMDPLNWTALAYV